MIDAHHHFWRYTPQEYGWIGPGMEVLQRDYLMEDLRPHMRAHGVTGLIAVQASQTVAETEWLLDLAGEHDEILGVVGWVPLAAGDVTGTLERLSTRSRLKGVRHVLQDERDDKYMLRHDFNGGVAALRRLGLVYDILIYERHLPQTLSFVDRHPDQLFVLDHMGKPRIRDGAMSSWREGIAAFASREHVFCKISGLVTEAHWHAWTPADLQPYLDVVLDVFGPRRLMFGSDWPVLLLAADYGRWVQTVTAALQRLSRDEQAWITHRTAQHAYRLG